MSRQHDPVATQDGHIGCSADTLKHTFGNIVDGYEDTICAIFTEHSATTDKKCKLSVKRKNNLAVIIHDNPVIDTARLEHFRSVIPKFDEQCFEVSVNFHDGTTTYWLSDHQNISENNVSHYFYSNAPVAKSKELAASLLAHFNASLAKSRINPRSCTMDTVHKYLLHCEKLPRFAVYEQYDPIQKTTTVIINGVLQCDATLIQYILSETDATHACAVMPRCIGEIQVTFSDELHSKKRKREANFITKIWNYIST
jgi:hypothetical protein